MDLKYCLIVVESITVSIATAESVPPGLASGGCGIILMVKGLGFLKRGKPVFLIHSI